MKKTRHQGIVITQTPFRISFFGGGTDFADYFNQHGGTVIGAAIDKHIYVTINSLERFFEKRIRLSYSKHEIVDNTDELQHDIVRCILESHPHFEENDFLDIHTFADLPASSGVGSSSSFCVGMLNALYLLRGIYKTPGAIAKEAIQIERLKLREAGGWQDQIFAAHGGFSRIHFANNDYRVEPICLSAQNKQALESACMMFFIGGTRKSAEVQAAVIKDNPAEKARHLDSIRQYAEKAFTILTSSLTAQDLLSEFGGLLHLSWLAKRNLSSHISNNHIDSLYEKGMQAGALGGKLCGAGGGGFLLFIVPPEKRAAMLEAFSGFKHLDIKFEDHGSRAIYSRICSPDMDSSRVGALYATP